MKLRLASGLVARPTTVELADDEKVIVVPSGCGHIFGVGNEGIGAVLSFEGGRTYPTRFVQVRSLQPGTNVLVPCRFGWQRGTIE